MFDSNSKSRNFLLFKQPSLLQQSLLLIAACFLIAYRQPANLTEPRFWCEEGTYFFSYAFSHSWFDTLIYVVPHLGYYSLAQNLSGLAATFVPLEQAPFVTTYLGFFSHLLPCCIVITGNSAFWDNTWKKALICLAILFFPFGATWLNTTYIHFTLALTLFLIMLEDTEQHNRLTRYLYRLLILIGGLSGAVSCFLTPAFILRASRSRRKEDVVQALLLVLASIIQLAVMIYNFSNNAQSANYRFSSFGFDQFWSIVFFQFGIPFYGHSYFNSAFIKVLDYSSFAILVPTVYPYLGNATTLLAELATQLSVLLVIVYTGFIIIKQLRNKLLQLPAVSFLLVFALSSIGSVQMFGGARYTYVPSVMMFIMFVAEFANNNTLLRKGLAASFILSMLFVNIYEYRKSTESYPAKWSDEVHAWQKDHSHKLKIWRDGWEMSLTP